MEVRRNDLVFLDTNALIEAFRVSAWPSLAGAFRLATVETCCVEADRGDARSRGYVAVDVPKVRATAMIERATPPQLAALDIRLGAVIGLDAGERELLAHLITRQDAWLVCSPDTACVLALHHLALLERSVALEQLLDGAGVRASLRYNHTRRWLEALRTQIALGRLL